MPTTFVILVLIVLFMSLIAADAKGSDKHSKTVKFVATLVVFIVIQYTSTMEVVSGWLRLTAWAFLIPIGLIWLRGGEGGASSATE